MRRAEAEKLLGGHATGTLTAEERRILFEAALAHQDLFDALMDEEALRELLADPAARAQVLAALAPAEAAAPKVVPFWRHPGVLGAAAGVLAASLAGLTWLRSPQAPPPVQQEPARPKALSIETLPEAPAEPEPRRHGPARPRLEKAPPPAAGISAPTPMPTPAAAAPAPAAAAVPVPVPAPAPGPVPMVRDDARAADEASSKPPAPQAVVEVQSIVSREASAARAKAAQAEAGTSRASAPALPAWTLAPQPDGTTLVTVTVPPQAQVWLLKRGEGGVEVLQDRAAAFKEARQAQRRYQVRLRAGDALDLYVMAHSVADPAKLPETGPVAGFRARIFPAEKRDPVP